MSKTALWCLGLMTLGLVAPAWAARPMPAPSSVDNPHLARRAVHEYTVARPDGSSMHYFVRPPAKASAATAPIVIFQVGSGCNAQFFLRGGELRNSLYGMLAALAPDAVVAAPEKRGVPFGFRTGHGQDTDCPDEYVVHATRSERIADTLRTLDALRAQGFRSNRVLLVGHSEGADVVAGAAGERRDVSHVAFLAGGGAMQMYELAVLARREMVARKAPPADIEAAISRMEGDYRAIQADPASTTKKFQGHAYRRWTEFVSHPPMEGLLKTKAKLFLAHGSADTSVPIESFDLLVMELIRAGKREADMRVRRVPGGDHGFGTGDAYGPSLETIFQEVLAWFLAR